MRELSSGQKAKKTGQWAKIMAKWLITYSSKGKPWKIVSFEGKEGGESRGIVDFIAIRRNHKFSNEKLKAGDIFEIILIQAKGGTASFPTDEEISRLIEVKNYYHAKHIVLANWKKREKLNFYYLINRNWKEGDAKEIFK